MFYQGSPNLHASSYSRRCPLHCAGVSRAQNTTSDVPPVIDVHVYALDESLAGLGSMCPNTSKFTASDPDTKEAPFGWVQEECTPNLYPAAKGEYLKNVISETERLNLTTVVFGDPKRVQKWIDVVPGRVIPGTRDFASSTALYAHEQLVKAGVEAGLHVWEGLFHGFSYNVDVPESKDALNVIIKFFHGHWGQK